MKTMKLTLVAMGMMVGLLNAGSAMAQGYYYEDGGYGRGGVVVSSGCGDPNCGNPNCGGGGRVYSGGNNGGTVIYSGGREMQENRVNSGGQKIVDYRPPMSGGQVIRDYRPPMTNGTSWQIEQERIRQERIGIRVQDPGMAMVGGILGGIGGALNNDRAKNGAAGDILNGIGNGFILGAQPEVYYDSRELYREQGNVINWGR
jgi:hypothetical protein